MENSSPRQREDRLMKIFAVIGFVVLILLAAWLAIQVVRMIPGAFSSLASLADSVYNSERNEARPLDVTTSNSVVQSGATFDLSWTDTGTPGSYQLAYSCTSGVSLTLRAANGELVPVACDTPYTFAPDTYRAELMFVSARTRFTDVSYRILFEPNHDEDADSLQTGKTLTVVNMGIPLTGTIDNEDTASETDTDTTPNVAVDETPTSPSTTPTPVQYRTVETVVYEVPKSDPNGYTELAVTFIGLGTLNSRNEFVPTSSFEEGDHGAFKFEVKNTGTKTSTGWDFKAELPSGQRYLATLQDPLKPNESAVFTIAFDYVGDEGTHDLEVTVSGGNDRSTSNNSFSRTVRVTD